MLELGCLKLRIIEWVRISSQFLLVCFVKFCRNVLKISDEKGSLTKSLKLPSLRCWWFHHQPKPGEFSQEGVCVGRPSCLNFVVPWIEPHSPHSTRPPSCWWDNTVGILPYVFTTCVPQLFKDCFDFWRNAWHIEHGCLNPMTYR